MNERIRELAEQAGIYKLNLSDETEYWIMEKFAELIVRECADIADKAEPYKTSDLIRKHFGVEE
jgi:hypothetical protein